MQRQQQWQHEREEEEEEERMEIGTNSKKNVGGRSGSSSKTTRHRQWIRIIINSEIGNN